jgi:hypothetical protein
MRCGLVAFAPRDIQIFEFGNMVGNTDTAL